jgi:hypothetical protein
MSSIIHVEVRPRTNDDDENLAAAPPPIPELLKNRIDELGASIAEIATKLRTRIDTIESTAETGNWALSEVSLQFSLDLGSEVGVIVARAKATAGFEAELKWSRKADK